MCMPHRIRSVHQMHDSKLMLIWPRVWCMASSLHTHAKLYCQINTFRMSLKFHVVCPCLCCPFAGGPTNISLENPPMEIQSKQGLVICETRELGGNWIAYAVEPVPAWHDNHGVDSHDAYLEWWPQSFHLLYDLLSVLLFGCWEGTRRNWWQMNGRRTANWLI